jgi:hypothetical protein
MTPVLAEQMELTTVQHDTIHLDTTTVHMRRVAAKDHIFWVTGSYTRADLKMHLSSKV